jgi:hypothetical protein
LCRHCSGGRCHDRPSESEPLNLHHHACGGKGCEGCQFWGHLKLTDCPQRRFDSSIKPVLTCARLANKGVLPMDGGLLSQTQQFMEAFEQISSESNHWRNKLKLQE